MIVGMIIGAWIMVSLSLAVYWVFYSDKNDYSPVFIYPFELRIHFSDGDKVLTYNRCGERVVLYRNFYIEKNVICLECAYSVGGFLKNIFLILVRKSMLAIFLLGTFEN